MSAVREVHRVSWLKKITSNDRKKSFKNPHVEKVWMVFCIHDDRFPFLEQYKNRANAASHLPLFAYPLTECSHVTTSIRPTLDGEHEFVVTLRRDVVKFSSPKRELVAEWVTVLRVQLRQLRVFQASANVYSRSPRPKLSIPGPSQQSAGCGGGLRDPTSPLPAPPVTFSSTESHSVPIVSASSSHPGHRFSFVSSLGACAASVGVSAVSSLVEPTGRPAGNCRCSGVTDDSARHCSSCTVSSAVGYVAENAYCTWHTSVVTNQAEPEIPSVPPEDVADSLSRHVTVISVGDPLLMLTLDGRCADADEERDCQSVPTATHRHVSAPTTSVATQQLHSSTSLPVHIDSDDDASGTYERLCEAFSSSSVIEEIPSTAGGVVSGSPDVPISTINTVGRGRSASVCHVPVQRSHSSGGVTSDCNGDGGSSTAPQWAVLIQPQARLRLLYRQTSDIGQGTSRGLAGIAAAFGHDSSVLTHTTLGVSRNHAPTRHPVIVDPRLDGGRTAATMSQCGQHVSQLRREIACRSGIRVALPRRTVVSALVFVDAQGALWLCGWKWKDQPALSCALHLGDCLLSVCGISVNSHQQLSRALKQLANSSVVELLLRRLPNAMVMTIERDTELQSLGIIRGHGTAEVTQVVADGLAARHGLPDRCRSLGSPSFCNWYISELNGRPVGLFARNVEIERRLNAVGREISLVLLPLDLIQPMKRHLRNIGRNYKQFVVE